MTSVGRLHSFRSTLCISVRLSRGVLCASETSSLICARIFLLWLWRASFIFSLISVTVLYPDRRLCDIGRCGSSGLACLESKGTFILPFGLTLIRLSRREEERGRGVRFVLTGNLKCDRFKSPPEPLAEKLLLSVSSSEPRPSRSSSKKSNVFVKAVVKQMFRPGLTRVCKVSVRRIRIEATSVPRTPLWPLTTIYSSI